MWQNVMLFSAVFYVELTLGVCQKFGPNLQSLRPVNIRNKSIIFSFYVVSIPYFINTYKYLFSNSSFNTEDLRLCSWGLYCDPFHSGVK